MHESLCKAVVAACPLAECNSVKRASASRTAAHALALGLRRQPARVLWQAGSDRQRGRLPSWTTVARIGGLSDDSATLDGSRVNGGPRPTMMSTMSTP
jgi:hypothetical protein